MDGQSFAPVTMCFTKAALAAGTTSTITTTGTTTYAIRSKFYTKGALTNQAAPTTDWATGNAFLPVLANQGTVFTVGFDHSGNLKMIQGTITALDTSGNFIVAPQFGGLAVAGSDTTKSEDFCPIGYMIAQNGASGSSWAFPASWTATGMTATPVDICVIPDRPQVS